jgi:hypothetical protein
MEPRLIYRSQMTLGLVIVKNQNVLSYIVNVLLKIWFVEVLVIVKIVTIILRILRFEQKLYK